MSPLWQFKAVSLFLYYNLPHAPSSQPFLISHFVAACEAPLFLSVFHNELWRYSEACAAENSCLCKRGPASCSVSARLTLKISLKAAARIAHRRADTKNKHAITHGSSWKSSSRPAAALHSPLPPHVIKWSYC